jgi:FAD/FMN-containing dehydrogenase
MTNVTLPSNVGRIINDPVMMSPFLSDWGGVRTGKARCVVQPETTQQVSQLLQWCSKHRVPVVPQGGNTGLVGGGIPDSSGAAILLSLVRLNRIRAVDPINNTLTVDAGVILETVQKVALEADRLFPLSLGAQGSCTIGGNLASNAGGTGVVRYGNARELCLGVEVVTVQGDIYDGLRGLRKDNSGYDLRDLYIGSEGTLGIITGATLKLFPRPKAQVTALVALTSPKHAVALLELTQNYLGPELTAFELMSRYCVDLVRRLYPDSARPFNEEPEWTILIESSDLVGEERCRERFEGLMEVAYGKGLIQDAAVAQSLKQSRDFWQLRERIGLSQPPNFKHDISLPISEIANFIEKMGGQIMQRFPSCNLVVLGHIGDGNLHYNLEYPSALPKEQQILMKQVVGEMVLGEVVRLGGSIAAEHGIGAAKIEILARYKAPVAMKIMGSMKKALDPFGILNPGKVLAHIEQSNGR